MRYFVFPSEGLSENLQAALTRGLGICSMDSEACRRHCERYGVEDIDGFVDELEDAQASLATAFALGAPVMVDPSGRLCFDLPRTEEKANPEAPWQNDGWLSSLFEGAN